MADKRYQVFISSTYTDLLDERRAVISALLAFGAIPAGMELFPASDDESWTLIKRVIDESDYYVLVIGGRYGSLDADGISFTEKEFDYAVIQRKPIMAFLHGQPEKLSIEFSDLDPDLRIKLDAFQKKAKNRNVKFWTSADNLSLAVTQSLWYLTEQHPAVGWVRADKGSPKSLTTELVDTRTQLAREHSLRVDAALNEPPAGTEWFDTFGSGAPLMTAEIERRLRNGKVRVRWLGVTQEAGWPIVQDLLLRLMRDAFGPTASLHATLAVVDPTGAVSQSRFAPDVEQVNATISKVDRFNGRYREQLNGHRSQVNMFTYDVRPSWHALLVDDNLAFYSLCVPEEIDLAAPQGGMEVLRWGRDLAQNVRIAHVAAWFNFMQRLANEGRAENSSRGPSAK